MNRILRKRPLTLAGLRGFEAAARHTSLTRAAQELNLTQSAVSRQVQGLEEELGVPLVVRRAREISLTQAGEQFYRVLQQTLERLDHSVERLRRQVAEPRIKISTFASFASLWLIPRLPSFRAQHPNVDIEVGATDRLVDLDEEDVDMAIRYLSKDRMPAGARVLVEESVFPVASPELANGTIPLKQLDDLNLHTLIDLSPAAASASEFTQHWGYFFGQIGRADLHGRGHLRFDFTAQVLQAAARSQGVALGTTLSAELLMEGALVCPFGESIPTGNRYFLLMSQAGQNRPEVAAFAAWITAEAERFNTQFAQWQRGRPSPISGGKARPKARSAKP